MGWIAYRDRVFAVRSGGMADRPMATDGYDIRRAILLIEATCNDVDIPLVNHSSRVAKRHVHTCI